MSTNKKWLFALNLLIFSKKDLLILTSGTNMSGSNFFSQNYWNYKKLWELSQDCISFSKKIIENSLQ